MTLNLQWQDSSVRAQDDFYRHCLGQWLDTFEIPADKAEFASFTDLHDTAQERLKAIIEDLSAQSPDPGTNAGRIAVLFNAFMDTDQIQRVGLEPIGDLFAQVDALRSAAELPGLFGRLERLGIGSPLGGAVHQDNRDSTRYVLDMWQSGLGLPDRDYYLEEDFSGHRKSYLEHVATMLERCGVGTADDAARIVELETRLARSHWTQVANRDPVKTYNQYKLDELSDLTPGYDWTAYLDAVGVGGRIETLNIAQPDYARSYASSLLDGY